jgi:hypothetical protein
MTQPKNERPFRVLSIDGGPSAIVHLRLLRKIEAHLPGFLDRSELLTGTSDGALVNVYLAHALTQGRSGLEALDGCIEYHNELLRAFKMGPWNVLRLASGLLSMSDGSDMRKVLRKHLGEATLRSLRKPVSLTAFEGVTMKVESFRAFGPKAVPETPLVEAAYASSSFTPIVAAFKDITSTQEKRIIDGVFNSNTTILASLSAAIEFLQQEQLSAGLSHNSVAAADTLHRISLLSLGCRVNPIITKKWKKLFDLGGPEKYPQYGLLWMLFSLLAAPAGLIQRDAEINGDIAKKLLGSSRYYRFTPPMAIGRTILGVMVDPDKVIQRAETEAQRLWDCVRHRLTNCSVDQSEEPLLTWIERVWMKDPPQHQSSVSLPLLRVAAD